MMHFYQTIVTHRNLIKTALLLVSVVVMTLGFTASASADGDGFSP